MEHPYRIVFLPTTRLRMCDALPSNLTGLDPVKYESINDGSLNTDYLVDVIGQIVEVSHVKVVSVNGKDTQKLSLELRNQDDDRLPMVLWGKFATDVNDAIQLRGEHKIIIVLRFGKIKVWKDERSISNAYNVSDNVETFGAETNQIPAPPDGVDITGAIAVEPEVYEIKKYFDASFSLYETGLVMSDEEVLNATLILIDNLLRRETICVKLLIKGSTVVGTTRKTYQLILGDEQGSTIQATFTKDLDDSFEIPMEEGDWYELQNFEVAYAFGVTRVTRYRHQINLSDSSIIFKIPPLSFCHYYRFQTFENIQRGLAHPKFSIGGFKHVKTIDGFS
ncbi:hypothetical protein HID58_087038 [Brassica napus]|uniref:Replication protein A 70 kDa DNA-binding subunit B/D first OB fold domain-containing protein n=1 Tax=Brassica napus TaxID=3708 RepID=A0ABQ7XTZ5_BRANA|nr:hypothetical protein HID58_087038 [Brassica napus]